MFEHSLLSLETKKPAKRRWLSLPIAIGLHAVALATFTFASYWHVEGVAEPQMAIGPYVVVSLPALPQAKVKLGGGAPPEVHKAVAAAPQQPQQTVQPQQSADKLPVLDTAPSTPGLTLVDVPIGIGDPLGVKDGDPHGSRDGLEGVPFDQKGSGGPGDKGADEPIRHVTGAVTRPVLVDGPQPRYTEMARRAGVQGTVIVEAIIDESGHVTDVRILKSLPMGLDLAAVDAVKTWRFRPATLAGRPVKVYYTLTANFTLQR